MQQNGPGVGTPLSQSPFKSEPTHFRQLPLSVFAAGGEAARQITSIMRATLNVSLFKARRNYSPGAFHR